MTPTEERRARALAIAVEYYRKTSVTGTQDVLAMAADFERFIRYGR